MKDSEKVKTLFNEAIGHQTSYTDGFDTNETEYLKKKASGLQKYLDAESCSFDRSFIMTIKTNDYYTSIFKITHKQYGDIFPQFSIPRKKHNHVSQNEGLNRIWTKGPFKKFVWSTLDLIIKSNANPRLLYFYFQGNFDKLEEEFELINYNKSFDYDNFPFPLPF